MCFLINKRRQGLHSLPMDASEWVSYVEKLNWENLIKFLMYKVKFSASLTTLAGLKKIKKCLRVTLLFILNLKLTITWLIAYSVWDNYTSKNERKYSYSGSLRFSVGHQPYISQVPLCVSKQMPVLIPKENKTI